MHPIPTRRCWLLRAFDAIRDWPFPIKVGALLGLAMILMLLALPAHADSEARNGADFVRFTALPCSDAKVQALLRAAGADPTDFRAASAVIGGQMFMACWRPDFQQSTALIMFDDGDTGAVPFAAIKPIQDV